MKKKGILKLIIGIVLLATLPITVQARQSNPATPPEKGICSTVVYARLFNDKTDVTANKDYEVKAFMGGECRAVSTSLSLSNGSTILVFRIWGDDGMGGNDEMGQTITFLVHDSASGNDYDVTSDETITFRGDYTYGMPSTPVALRFGSAQSIRIEELQATKDHIIVYQKEGDVRERLDALINIQPAESKQTFHWELEQATVPGMLTFNDTSGTIDAKNEGVATVVAVADADPAIRSAAVTISVINPARTLVATGESLVVYLTGQESLDISDDLNSRIYIGPQGYSSIRVNYSSSDPSVVSTHHDEASGQQVFLARTMGSSVITTSLTYLNCYTETDTTITMDITVYVSQPIKNITVSATSIQVCRDSVTMLTLRAQPEGAVLSSENINLIIADTLIARLGNFEVEDGASFVEVPIEGLFPGTTSVSNAIHPDSIAKTLAKVDVVVPLQLSKGWQWVTCYMPTAISGDALESAYGASLMEVRSQSETLFNDPDYGYIGSLYENGLRQNECYKIHMAADASHVFERPAGNVTPYPGGTIDINGRWSWIGNPYYCNHPLEGYVNGAMEEDMIVGQKGFAVFYDGQWNGSLEALHYGEAYMYYAEQTHGTLQFKAEGFESDLKDDDNNEEYEETNSVRSHIRGEAVRHSSAKGAFTPCDSHRFMDNMCVIATLGDDFTSIDNCQIGAFVGNDCRGMAYAKGGYFFLTVHGDAGETVCLQVYDVENDTYYDIEGTIELKPLVGSMKKPLLIHKHGYETSVLDISGSESMQKDDYYSLQGIRLRQAPQKGIYIHKGRKVVVR